LDRLVGDLLGELEHVADPLGREVRPDRVARDVEEGRDPRHHRRIDELGAKSEQDLLLAARPVEVVVAGALAGPNEGEGGSRVERLRPGVQPEPVRAAVEPVVDGSAMAFSTVTVTPPTSFTIRRKPSMSTAA
jgi:hypothetical protein